MKDYKSHGKAQRLLRQLRCLAMTGFFLFLLFTTYSLQLTAAYADIPHLINYQGKLTDKDNKPVPDTSHLVTFRIYDAESSGTLLWEETQSVTPQKGIFSVMLGGATALNLAFDKPYWLEIKVGNEVMSPRQRIASVGYAIRAETAEQAINADKIDNCDAGTSANNVLKLTDTAKIPSSAFKVYDSGWFGVSANNTYTQTHNLGTTKVLLSLYISDSSSGGDNCLQVAVSDNYDGSNESGVNTYSISTTTISIRTADNKLYRANDGSGTTIVPTSGYARIIMLALE